ncbi:hypothetical protein GCM10007421_16910 [Halopseudomonas oceani]|uniref:hypothetical protein n=1 Tax=Halopseudomonas oceani TaxID=1708783 RepID=UPI0014764F39|nr:hypothetical protein [Halopseudomonas oceani]GGE43314.1 hypothetical protein GCM10007421_16910 [Halopseudomonas oceani]
MQDKKPTIETNAADSAVEKKRKNLRLSDLDANTMSDLQSMFGMWKEADHCDKSYDIN